MVQDPVSSEILILGGVDSEGNVLTDTWASIDGGVSWIARPRIPVDGSSNVVVGHAGSLRLIPSNSDRLLETVSDLKYIQKDCFFLLLVGRSVENIIPKEVWVGTIIPMTIDTRLLWQRKDSDWRNV